MQRVTSKDGTRIAYDQTGEGPPLILVTGALGTRSDATLASNLAQHLTVVDYNRRGRGDSGDTAPYAVEREVEDIEALIDAAGGTAYVYGISSGAVLALEAASNLPAKITKLVLYEPPFILDDSRPPLPSDYVARINEHVAAGRQGEAVKVFMTDAIMLPDEWLEPMQQSPDWQGMEKVAHTLAYDGTIMGDTMSGKPLPEGRWSTATMPTLVINGGESERYFHDAARTLAGMLPNAQYRILEGQDHNVDANALAPVLEMFFRG